MGTIGVSSISQCGQYTILVGLTKIAEDYLANDESVDLLTLKERIMQKVLNINNYIKSLCEYYDRTDGSKASAKKSIGVSHLEKFIRKNEFFVYSVSVTFNPKIVHIDHLKFGGSTEGDGVCTITAKLPKDKDTQSFYLRLMLKCISKNSMILKMNAESTSGTTVASILSSKQRSIKTSSATITSDESSTVLRPIPRYFDDDYDDQELNTCTLPNEGENIEKKEATDKLPLKAPIGPAYSFFNQSSMILSKYANSKLVVRDEDKFVSERLLKEKQRRKTALRF